MGKKGKRYKISWLVSIDGDKNAKRTPLNLGGILCGNEVNSEGRGELQLFTFFTFLCAISVWG